MSLRYQARRTIVVPVLGLLLAAALAACSSGGSGTSSPAPASTPASSAAAPASPTASGGSSAAAVTEIKANWAEFFNSATPNSKRVELLENGTQFSSAITAFSANPFAQSVTSKVDTIKFTSASKASVTYDLTAGGISVAKGAKGTSVLQNGVWKVGDDVFCGLLTQGSSMLGIPVPAACK